MHAVLTTVAVEDYTQARKSLQDEVVPTVSQLPGFVSGVWLAPEDGASGEGTAIVVFESEDAARAMQQRLETQPPPNVDLRRVEVREVAARA